MRNFKYGDRVKLPAYFGGHEATVIRANAGNDRVAIRTLQPVGDGICAELTIHENRLIRIKPAPDEPRFVGATFAVGQDYAFIRTDAVTMAHWFAYRIALDKRDGASRYYTWEDVMCLWRRENRT